MLMGNNYERLEEIMKEFNELLRSPADVWWSFSLIKISLKDFLVVFDEEVLIRLLCHFNFDAVAR